MQERHVQIIPETRARRGQGRKRFQKPESKMYLKGREEELSRKG
jgi:hypothetical protein